MAEKISARLQNILKWFIPLLLIFAIFFAVAEKKEESIIVFPDGKTGIEILEELDARGYISNKLSYFIARASLIFGFDIESGGFLLSQNMGPFGLLAALASPDYRYVAVNEGLRTEEIAEIFAKKLDWTEEEKDEFSIPEHICLLVGGEGFLFPGKYLVNKDDNPEDVKKIMEEKLNQVMRDVSNTETGENQKILNMNQIITIASLIQREAAGKNDMKLISGIIWNRIFNGMPLQIDATLQYVKGSEEKGWWPIVKSEDKYLESPYNTYQNDGLPPGPIANPGIAAIEAALNPVDTDCIFYLHDRNRVIHCSKDYKAHKENVRRYLK